MIKVGNITTSELVSMFGTDANKKAYKLKNKLYKITKESILNRAYTKCEINDLGNGNYEIGNCEFIEFKEHIRFHKKMRPKNIKDEYKRI